MCQYWRWHRSFFGVFFLFHQQQEQCSVESVPAVRTTGPNEGGNEQTGKEREATHEKKGANLSLQQQKKTAMPLGFVVFWRYFHSFPFLLLLHHHYSEVSNLQQEQVLWPVNRISILQLLLLPPLLFTLIVQAAAADAVWCFHYRSEMVVLLLIVVILCCWLLTTDCCLTDCSMSSAKRYSCLVISPFFSINECFSFSSAPSTVD